MKGAEERDAGKGNSPDEDRWFISRIKKTGRKPMLIRKVGSAPLPRGLFEYTLSFARNFELIRKDLHAQRNPRIEGRCRGCKKRTGVGDFYPHRPKRELREYGCETKFGWEGRDQGTKRGKFRGLGPGAIRLYS